MLARARLLLLLLLPGCCWTTSVGASGTGITTVGAQKLATASDCSKPVAFSATHSSVKDGQVVLKETLLDQGVGFAASTGTFTTYCPGLYQFSFAGYGDGLQLKRLKLGAKEWQPVASLGFQGGSNLVLLRLAVGDQIGLFLEPGKQLQPDHATSFSGYRIAKE